MGNWIGKKTFSIALNFTILKSSLIWSRALNFVSEVSRTQDKVSRQKFFDVVAEIGKPAITDSTF